MRYMRRNIWADAAECASIVRHPRTYREHAHRGIMLQPDYWIRRDTTDEAFWPTCRDRGPVLPSPIVNCQRCGHEIPMNSGWWCRHCHGVARWLQQTQCMSMVQIAASGEYDPPWAEWVQDVAPWLLWKKLELPRSRGDEWGTCLGCKKFLPPGEFIWIKGVRQSRCRACTNAVRRAKKLAKTPAKQGENEHFQPRLA